MRSALHARRDDEMDSTSDGDDRDPLMLPRSSSENALRQTAADYDYGSTSIPNPSNRLVAPASKLNHKEESYSGSTKGTPTMMPYSPSPHRSRATPMSLTSCCCPQDEFGDYGVATSKNGGEEDEFEYVMHAKEKLLGKTDHFDLPNSPERGFRATTFAAFRLSRPYMRAMHASWICFFASYSVQFAMAPLLPQLKLSLNLSKQDIWLVGSKKHLFDVVSFDGALPVLTNVLLPHGLTRVTFGWW